MFNSNGTSEFEIFSGNLFMFYFDLLWKIYVLNMSDKSLPDLYLFNTTKSLNSVVDLMVSQKSSMA